MSQPQASVKMVEIATGPVAVSDQGEGPALVALHGLPGSTRDFRALGEALGGRLRLISIDQPGFGGTPLSTAPSPEMARRALVCHQVLTALGVEKYVVLGHSMGGALATELAFQDPARVAGVALVSSVGVRPHRIWRLTRPPLVHELLQNPGLQPFLLPLGRLAMRRLGLMRASDGDELLMRTMDCAAHTWLDQHRISIEDLKVPTLVAWCDDDRLVEKRISEELAAACPAGPRLRYPKGGHLLQRSHAAELADALADWVPPTVASFSGGKKKKRSYKKGR